MKLELFVNLLISCTFQYGRGLNTKSEALDFPEKL